MYKFKKFNIEALNPDREAIEDYFEIIKLALLHKERLFDDFAKESVIEHITEIVKLYTPYFWVIRAKRGGEFVGFVYLYDFIGNSETTHSASVATCFSRKFWGKPARDAGRMFLNHCFKKMGMKKIKAECFASNHYVTSFLRNLRFRKEGVLKNETIVGGKPENLVIWGIYAP